MTIFRVGALYTHEEIYSALKVGNAGGIRPSVEPSGMTRRLVMMTSDPSAKVLRENPYHDRIEGDVLVYSAVGLEGAQAFTGVNRRVLDQLDNQFPIYGFRNMGSRRNSTMGQRRWKFLGLLQYLRHFIEKQTDARGETRDTVVFELLILTAGLEIFVANDHRIARDLYAPRASIFRDPQEREVESKLNPAETREDSGKIEAARRSLLGLPPQRFEYVVKEALEATGFQRVAVTRYTADGGIDVNAFAGSLLWPYFGGLLQMQAKRWLHTVGAKR